jgi:MoaA/NifB/PqqE/SkfB family radical SAM enzyme
VRLTGGEPFARADLLEIAELARRYLQPVMLHVTTNGFLTDRIVELCERRERSRPLHLLVSLDGVGEDHDRIRGQRDAWKRALATLEELAPRRRELRLKLAVNQTIVDGAGARSHRELSAVLRRLGVDHQVVMGYDASATYSTSAEVEVGPRQRGQFDAYAALEGPALVELLDQLEADAATLPPAQRLAKHYYLRGLRSRLLDSGADPNPPCVALSSHLRLYPDGTVPTCQFNSTRVGSLRRQPFAELWAGEARRRQRDWVRGCPGCWAECEVLPSAVYSGDLLRAVVPGPRCGS